MPCYDSRNTYDSGLSQGRAERQKLQERADLNARVACKVLTILESIGLMVNDAEVKEWWETHKKWDEERKKNA